MSESRSPVPAAVKRQLRQEAGFGCCVCGLPIYQYHHIVEWNEEHHFRAEDMMLLCPLHHDAATKGALAEDDQRTVKADPFNLRQGVVAGQLSVGQRYLAVGVGGVLLVGDGALISIDGEPLLATSLEPDGVMAVSASLYDEEDHLVAEIHENEWISGDPMPWDIESDHQFLRLRAKAYDIRLDLDARREPVSIRAKLWRKGNRVSLRPRGVFVDNNNVSIQDLALVRIPLNISAKGIELGDGETGMIVSEPDPIRRLIKAVNAYGELKSDGAIAIGLASKGDGTVGA